MADQDNIFLVNMLYFSVCCDAMNCEHLVGTQRQYMIKDILCTDLKTAVKF